MKSRRGVAHTAVIGAGMTGLVTALRLLEAGDVVTVFERDAVPGGLAAGFVPVAGGANVERFYHHVFTSDRLMIGLCNELGLRERLFFTRPVTACFYGGTLRQLDSLATLLRFAPLSRAERLRLAFALGTLKLLPLSASLERRRAARWLSAVAGANAYRVVFEPLLRGKFGSAAEQISLGWFWARIHDRTPSLGYLRGGFATLYEALVARIRERGGNVAFDRGVTTIARGTAGFAITTTEGFAPAPFDRVVATIPLRPLAELCAALPAAFVRRYASAPGLAARCVVLALDRPLTGTYWVNVCEPDWPFVVVVEQTALVSPSDYGGRHLVYIGNYGESFRHASPAELAREFEPYLRRLNSAFAASWIVDAWQFVAAEAQPVVTPGYRGRIAPHRTPVPGLFLANLTQVYPHDRGQNYAIALAESLVAELRTSTASIERP